MMHSYCIHIRVVLLHSELYTHACGAKIFHNKKRKLLFLKTIIVLSDQTKCSILQTVLRTLHPNHI